MMVGLSLGLHHWWQKQRILGAKVEMGRYWEILYGVAIVVCLYCWLIQIHARMARRERWPRAGIDRIRRVDQGLLTWPRAAKSSWRLAPCNSPPNWNSPNPGGRSRSRR